jgi:hypothetical protein
LTLRPRPPYASERQRRNLTSTDAPRTDALRKPFSDVAEEIGLGKRFTQRGLRRTFNDLARTARVDALVTRSISGHLTERMQHHYSTVNSDEQRQGIAKVIELTKAREKRRAEAPDAADGSGGAPSGAPGAEGGAL